MDVDSYGDKTSLPMVDIASLLIKSTYSDSNLGLPSNVEPDPHPFLSSLVKSTTPSSPHTVNVLLLVTMRLKGRRRGIFIRSEEKWKIINLYLSCWWKVTKLCRSCWRQAASHCKSCRGDTPTSTSLVGKKNPINDNHAKHDIICENPKMKLHNGVSLKECYT